MRRRLLTRARASDFRNKNRIIDSGEKSLMMAGPGRVAFLTANQILFIFGDARASVRVFSWAGLLFRIRRRNQP
jgi:hypothetical protein